MAGQIIAVSREYNYGLGHDGENLCLAHAQTVRTTGPLHRTGASASEHFHC